LTPLHAMTTASRVPTIQSAGRDHLMFLILPNIPNRGLPERGGGACGPLRAGPALPECILAHRGRR
jgi:hypothetical protein